MPRMLEVAFIDECSCQAAAAVMVHYICCFSCSTAAPVAKAVVIVVCRDSTPDIAFPTRSIEIRKIETSQELKYLIGINEELCARVT